MIGQSVARREDQRLLTGRGQFVADIRRPGLLEVEFVRSLHAHATISSIDVTAAERSPGVHYILTGRSADLSLAPLPGMQVAAPAGWANRVEHRIELPAQPLLAGETVRFVGEAVGLVVAQTKAQAQAAAEAFEVEYEPLPAVTDAALAEADGATLIHPDLGTNQFASMVAGKGDIEAALASAPHRCRRVITHHRYAAMPLECRAGLAEFDERTGVLTLWTTSQVVHWVQARIAAALNLAEEQVRIVAPDVGGGFGVKGHAYPEELLLAHLAMQLGRPVRWVESRQEHFLAATHSRDQRHEVDFGFDDSGRLLALKDDCWLDSGAYCPVGAGVAYNTTAHMLGPYEVGHFQGRITVVATNKAPNAPYRGAGRPEAVQVMERVLDVIAAKTGLEPAEVRFRNLIQRQQMPYPVGLPYRDGQSIVYDSGDYPKALRRALDAVGGVPAFRERQAAAREEGRSIGLGLGCYTEGTGVGPFEGARVRIDRAGRISVSVGACAQGQGHETIFAQVAAKFWQVPMEQITFHASDTAAVALGYGTVGSRSTVTASMAIEEASEELRERVLAIAADELEASPQDLELRDAHVSVRGAPDVRLSLGEIAQAAMPGWQRTAARHLPAGLETTAHYEPPTVTWAYAANAAIVEVFPETGIVKVLSYVEVHDAGVLVNPMLADGQVTGGIVQGLGGALQEAVVYDREGQLITGSFMDYAMPRASDFPDLTVLHEQTPSPLNSLGVKGLGEGGAIAPPVVIANAAGDALRELGVEFNSLPLGPEAVWRRIREGLNDSRE